MTPVAFYTLTLPPTNSSPIPHPPTRNGYITTKTIIIYTVNPSIRPTLTINTLTLETYISTALSAHHHNTTHLSPPTSSVHPRTREVLLNTSIVDAPMYTFSPFAHTLPPKSMNTSNHCPTSSVPSKPLLMHVTMSISTSPPSTPRWVLPSEHGTPLRPHPTHP